MKLENKIKFLQKKTNNTNKSNVHFYFSCHHSTIKQTKIKQFSIKFNIMMEKYIHKLTYN